MTPRRDRSSAASARPATAPPGPSAAPEHTGLALGGRRGRAHGIGTAAVAGFAAIGMVALSACGATAAGGNTTTAPTAAAPPTVELAGLPAPLATTTTTTEDTDAAAETTDEPAPTTTEFDAPGNRILMIGDSILASTSKRYSNDMCAALVPLGWQVEIEAEVSRGIDFGIDVMRARRDGDWDAGLVFLGTNYGNDDNAYLKSLNRIITDFGDIPIVLVTVSEFRAEMREVNRVIEGLTEVYDRISIVDWAAITAEFPELLNDDGIHPTSDGRKILAQAVAEHLGTAPDEPGRCLDSVFTDDSEGSIDGNSGSGGGSGSSGSSGSGSGSTNTTVKPTTTVKPGATTTTVRPGVTTTSMPGGPTTTAAGGSSTTVAGGQPGTTVASTSPATTPPATAPPATTPPTPPPATSPPQTQAPTSAP